MSKIAEEKALEAYPMVVSEQTIPCRLSYSEGYDQAMQDILEKAEELFYEQFNIHPHDCHVVQYVSDTPLEDIDGFVATNKEVYNELILKMKRLY